MAALFIDERLRSDEPLCFVWSMLAGVQQAEVYARSDAEAVLCDMQHGLIGYSDMQAMVQAIQRGGKPAFVRPPLDDFAMVSRALDAGAAAVIMPMINSVDDARKLVAAAKYPSLGERSWGPFAAMNAAGLDAAGYLAGANQLTKVFGMIETADALDALEEICAVDGLDGVFVGPYDLSISLSGGTAAGAEYPGVQDALPRIVAAAQAAGKVPGIYASGPAQVKAFSAMGFRLISAASDSSILLQGLSAALR